MKGLQAVPVELMMVANQAIDDAGNNGLPTLIVVSRALRGRCSEWDVVSVYNRLYALTQAFKNEPSNELVINAHGRDYKVMNEVLFYAALRRH